MPEMIRPLYYWLTARSEKLIYDFVYEEIHTRLMRQNYHISTKETVEWIRTRLLASQNTWTDGVLNRVAAGLLAALRDFGILKGIRDKRIAPPFIPTATFAYLAFALNHIGFSGTQLLRHPDWKLFLLTPATVERLFMEAHQQALLKFQIVGSVVRVDFPAEDYEEMADVIYRRTN